MAFGAKKIFPLDQRPSVGVGVGLPFNQKGVFQTTYTTQESIKYNLINFLLTNKTERYLTPNFGGNLRNFIFEQINQKNTDSLETDIQSLINQNFPNVIINNLNIDSLPDINQIVVNLTYSIKDTGISDNLELAFT